MRIPNAAHESRPWRIREIVPDFTLEDVWALPVHGGAEDFQTLLELHGSPPIRPTRTPLPTRVLWRLRDRLGSWFGLGRISAPVDAVEGGDRQAADSRARTRPRWPAGCRTICATRRRTCDFGSLPFAPLYRTDAEFAAEMSNQTVHGVMHLAWVDQGEGRYQGQMAVYVKPRGPLGKGYMALIKPFRHWSSTRR